VDIASYWQCSVSTLSDAIHQLTKSFLRLQTVLFKPPTVNETPETIKDNPKFYPYFEGRIAALNGSHISACSTEVAFRNRKSNIAQNVLAVTNFDLTFSYCFPG